MRYTHDLGIFLLEPAVTWFPRGSTAYFGKECCRDDNRAWHYAQGPP